MLPAAAPGPLSAAEIAFSGWTHQRFSLLGGNTWRQGGRDLGVESNGAVSLLWAAVPQASWQASTADWTWSVEVSVPPTDLSLRGGDDRNLSLYTIFAPPDVARAAQGMGIRKLLENPDIRVLMYVWGGAHDRGATVPSPYLGARGRTIVLRPAGVGQHRESVNLRADLARVYGRDDLALIGVAVSADSDDTKTRIKARIGNLRFSG
ncbi:DUF3047 domain-containing protein [Rhodobacter sp. ETT8]|uniref:DUF3047 domain-containing protein n=2 Tax=Pseudotabrizicola algicola TaxID=2709381 RepID=A0A6B3RJU9_9RHOB|nr:DUF3047 domain-containing protein [Pseudotabrizicola algicola]